MHGNRCFVGARTGWIIDACHEAVISAADFCTEGGSGARGVVAGRGDNLPLCCGDFPAVAVPLETEGGAVFCGNLQFMVFPGAYFPVRRLCGDGYFGGGTHYGYRGGIALLHIRRAAGIGGSDNAAVFVGIAFITAAVGRNGITRRGGKSINRLVIAVVSGRSGYPYRAGSIVYFPQVGAFRRGSGKHAQAYPSALIHRPVGGRLKDADFTADFQRQCVKRGNTFPAAAECPVTQCLAIVGCGDGLAGTHFDTAEHPTFKRCTGRNPFAGFLYCRFNGIRKDGREKHPLAYVEYIGIGKGKVCRDNRFCRMAHLDGCGNKVGFTGKGGLGSDGTVDTYARGKATVPRIPVYAETKRSRRTARHVVPAGIVSGGGIPR